MICWNHLGASVVGRRLGWEVLCTVKCHEGLALKDHSCSHLQCHIYLLLAAQGSTAVTPGRISGGPRSL